MGLVWADIYNPPYHACSPLTDADLLPLLGRCGAVLASLNVGCCPRLTDALLAALGRACAGSLTGLDVCYAEGMTAAGGQGGREGAGAGRVGFCQRKSCVCASVYVHVKKAQGKGHAVTACVWCAVHAATHAAAHATAGASACPRSLHAGVRAVAAALPRLTDFGFSGFAGVGGWV